ncbi:MAG: Hpt domain-containing protein [Fibrobacteria bacterium]
MFDCINFETLAALREIEKPGQMVFTAKLINAYLEDTEKRLKEVGTAHQSGNTGLLAKLAHAVKGSSLNVGADGLAALMMTIEREAEKGTLCDPERLIRMEASFRQVREALKSYLG